MSYMRFSEGDAYVVATGDGGITCVCCRLLPEKLGDWDWYDDFHAEDAAEMLDHMHAHRRAGHHITRPCLDRLRLEKRLDMSSSPGQQRNPNE